MLNSVLNKFQIDELITKNNWQLAQPDGLQVASYDLHTSILSKDFLDSLTADSQYPEVNNVFSMMPGYSAMFYSREVVDFTPINLGNDKNVSYIGAFVMLRSSSFRKGLSIASVGWVDPGFVGRIGFRLFNTSDRYIDIADGDRIVQMVFTVVSYNKELTPYSGQYQEHKGDGQNNGG